MTDACVFGDVKAYHARVRDWCNFCLCVGVWICRRVSVFRGRVCVEGRVVVRRERLEE